MSEWQTIDTAPKDGTPVLLFGKLNGEICTYPDKPEIIIGAFGCGRCGRWSMHNTDTYGVDCDPTHWMPLPSPPHEEEEAHERS